MTVIPAEADAIIDVLWARVRDGKAWSCNWGTAMDNSIWHVGKWTYINGIIMHIDFDYEGMWLLEVCDRDPDDHSDPTQVRWLAVATGHWPEGVTLKHEWYPATEPQVFFKRSVNTWEVITWASAWYKKIDVEGR
jgi:hypothetical protein